MIPWSFPQFQFSCLFLSRLAGGILFSTGPLVCPSVRTITDLVNMIFWKRLNQLCCKLARLVQKTIAWNGSTSGVRSQWSRLFGGLGGVKSFVDHVRGALKRINKLNVYSSKSSLQIPIRVFTNQIVSGVMQTSGPPCDRDNSFHTRLQSLNPVGHLFLVAQRLTQYKGRRSGQCLAVVGALNNQPPSEELLCLYRTVITKRIRIRLWSFLLFFLNLKLERHP